MVYETSYFAQNLPHSRHVCCSHKHLNLRCPLVDVLLYNHANVKDAAKCVGSDIYVVWNWLIPFRT